ncbi:hypothetical protein, partial [Eisenbergiella porci]|uniref:hypothetical protein n=1 Tax=Eisenbergiella porci TaxID=2652274 RepID=UPI002A805970
FIVNQISMQAWILGSLLAGIKREIYIGSKSQNIFPVSCIVNPVFHCARTNNIYPLPALITVG